MRRDEHARRSDRHHPSCIGVGRAGDIAANLAAEQDADPNRRGDARHDTDRCSDRGSSHLAATSDSRTDATPDGRAYGCADARAHRGSRPRADARATASRSCPRGGAERLFARATEQRRDRDGDDLCVLVLHDHRHLRERPEWRAGTRRQERRWQRQRVMDLAGRRQHDARLLAGRCQLRIARRQQGERPSDVRRPVNGGSMRKLTLAIAVLSWSACGPSYSDASKCDVTDKDNARLAACMANREPWYCGGDAGVAGGGTSLRGASHAFRYANKSDHICTKAELDGEGIAPEVRPTSQR